MIWLHPFLCGFIVHLGRVSSSFNKVNAMNGILLVVITLCSGGNNFVVGGVKVPTPLSLNVFVKDEIHDSLQTI